MKSMNWLKFHFIGQTLNLLAAKNSTGILQRVRQIDTRFTLKLYDNGVGYKTQCCLNTENINWVN